VETEGAEGAEGTATGLGGIVLAATGPGAMIDNLLNSLLEQSLGYYLRGDNIICCIELIMFLTTPEFLIFHVEGYQEMSLNNYC
jgi:hypothetical protein